VLSIGRIGAGDGWRYLTNQVATMDVPRAGERLHAYYQRTGYPPGMWIGRQAVAFGLAGPVDVQAMGLMFGRLAHPVTGQPLGRRPNQYPTLAERVQRHILRLGRPVGDTERAAIAAELAARPDPQPVAGFDLTFSAPKSVSVLFALAGPEMREQLRAAHDMAWRDAFDMFETEVAATRLGANGVAQVDVAGVAAAAFVHWYSRCGDPQLHTHVAVSTLVATTDGRWRRLDSRAIYRAAAAVSERYEATLIAAVSDLTGLRWQHHPSPRTGIVLSEIAGVPDRLLRAFSARRLAIETETARLAGNYQTRHGRSPDRTALARLAQAATLAHRPPGHERRLADQLQAWAGQAATILGCPPADVARKLAAMASGAGRPLRPVRRRKVEHHAQATMQRLTETAATWSYWDIVRHATAQLRETNHRADPATIRRLVTATLARADLFALETNPTITDAPIRLSRADGTSPYLRRGERRYSSTRIAQAEDTLATLAAPVPPDHTESARRQRATYGQLDEAAIVAALRDGVAHLQTLTARRDRRPPASPPRAVLDAEITELRQAIIALKRELVDRHQPQPTYDRHLKERLAGLGIDQAAAVVRLADVRRRLDALIGPAGSGKTTTLQALIDIWSEGHRKAYVLAPTAIAARVAGEKLGLAHDTIHAALGRWRHGNDLPAPGDLVIIDEASMATTPLLLAATQTALACGAQVRLVGDPHQLAAVGAGGGLALVAEAAASPTLVELHRFEHPWEAHATLALRQGDPAGLDAYFAHQRIRPNLDHAAVAEVVANWAASPAGIDHTVMVASDNHTVRQLNILARSHRVQTGQISAEGIQTVDGTTIGVGDLIVTRLNHRPHPGGPLLVRNRDRWTVQQIHPDHSILVANADRPRQAVTLPADYVARHLQLGYADTGHGVQGRTVTRAEVIIRPGDTRWYLYVALSRARQHTAAHIIIDQPEREPLYQPQRSARHILETVLTNSDPVSLSDWQTVTHHANTDPAAAAERYRHAQDEELRHRLTHTLNPLGAGHLLNQPDSWQLLHTAHTLEALGFDAAAVLGAIRPAANDSIAGVCDRLVEQARTASTPGPRPRWYAGVLPAPGPHVDRDVAAWLDTIGHQITTWRDTLAADIVGGQDPPRWAHLLGRSPTDPHAQQGWARAVAQVAMWRTTQRLTGADLLGPPLPPGHRYSPARARAAFAVQEARALSGTDRRSHDPPPPYQPRRRPHRYPQRPLTRSMLNRRPR
jgi:conjugative relaxase-like TrwC/TraI family protein